MKNKFATALFFALLIGVSGFGGDIHGENVVDNDSYCDIAKSLELQKRKPVNDIKLTLAEVLKKFGRVPYETLQLGKIVKCSIPENKSGFTEFKTSIYFTRDETDLTIATCENAKEAEKHLLNHLMSISPQREDISKNYVRITGIGDYGLVEKSGCSLVALTGNAYVEIRIAKPNADRISTIAEIESLGKEIVALLNGEINFYNELEEEIPTEEIRFVDPSSIEFLSEKMPWVDEKIWNTAFPASEDEFMELYGIPRKGSQKIDPQAFPRANNFANSFFGLFINGKAFVVSDKQIYPEEDYGREGKSFFMMKYRLDSLDGDSMELTLLVAESEQENLDLCPFPGYILDRLVNYYIFCAERIDWGTFCRRIQTHGGFLDFADGALRVLIKTDLTKEEGIDLLPAGKEISSLFRGEAKFLPENEPAFVKIREKAEDDKRKLAEEERKLEGKEAREKLLRILNIGALPLLFSEDIATQIENVAKMRETFNQTEGEHVRDIDAIEKLSLKNAEDVVETKISDKRYNSDNPMAFAFLILNATQTRVEVIHAKTFEEAWDWALFLRMKYSPPTELRSKISVAELARSTNINAFNDLGDVNLSWRGVLDSALRPENMSAESLIIFVRNTTVVCVANTREGRGSVSVLPLARAFDNLLLTPKTNKSTETSNVSE